MNGASTGSARTGFDEAERQRALMTQLLAARGDPAALATRESGVRALRGLQAYRANADASAARALGSAFPTVHAMVGDEDFEQLAREFWRAAPPERGDLGEWGAELPAWLAAHPQLGRWPYLGDCARLDWALHRCERAADDSFDAASMARLGDTEPDDLRLELAAHVALVESRWPVAMILDAHRRGDDAAFEAVRHALAQPAGESVFVARRGWRAEAVAVDALTAAWTRALLSGASLGAALAAAGESFDFAAWLAQAIPSGWVKGIRATRD
jgi:hypothetical protein